MLSRYLKTAFAKRRETRRLQKRIETDRKHTEELVAAFHFERKEDEPVAPWIECPYALAGCINWRMGHGEHYMHKIFGPFWRTRSPDQKVNYLKKFDLGDSWPDRMT
ncbi:MAG: hypothetical protein ACPG4X_22055 [Pikeienuella sp.]